MDTRDFSNDNKNGKKEENVPQSPIPNPKKEETPQEKKRRQQREWGERRKKINEEKKRKKFEKLNKLHENQGTYYKERKKREEEEKKMKKKLEENRYFLNKLYNELEEEERSDEEKNKKELCNNNKKSKILVFGGEKTKKKEREEEIKKEKRDFKNAKTLGDIEYLLQYYIKKRDIAIKKQEEKMKNEENEEKKEKIKEKIEEIKERFNDKYKEIIKMHKGFLDVQYSGKYPKDLPPYVIPEEFQKNYFKKLFGEKKQKPPAVPIEFILDEKQIKTSRRRTANKKYYAKKTGNGEQFFKTSYWGKEKENNLDILFNFVEDWGKKE